MNRTGYRHVRKVHDGRRKPYFGRFWFAGEIWQVGGFQTAAEAHQAAIEKKLYLSGTYDVSRFVAYSPDRPVAIR